ncbi:MAG: tRNA(fMet)-specific endonuclease VapC [Gammaproteobacteria bacterium]|nr:tRNA(fMet)-specific endonuclease VapC [Gammaproteobacteria bacterium]
MLKYMLDTNIAIYVIKRRPIEILQTFNQHAEQLCISTITLAELVHGVEKSALPEKNRKNVEDFVSRLEVLEYGNKAASHYGDIRADLERKGTTIGVNDLHISGHARSEGLILVTNNTREFERASGLRLENWIEG